MPRFSPPRASTSAAHLGDSDARGRRTHAAAAGVCQREGWGRSREKRLVDRRRSCPSARTSPGEVTARSLRWAGFRGDAVRDSCVAASTAGVARCLLVPHVLHSVWPRPRRDPRAGVGASSAVLSWLINPSRQNEPAAHGDCRSPRGLLPDQAVVPGVFFCRYLLRGQVIGVIRWPTDCLADQRPSAREFPRLLPPVGCCVVSLPDRTAAASTTAGRTSGKRARDSSRRCWE